jgi:hypothetical protein
MAYNIGINVVEVDGSASPTIPSAAVSVGAFNILTQRGVPNRPVLVTSFQQFAQQFGSFFPGGVGAYLVKGFFDNGGQNAYINRVISSDSLTGTTAASLTVQDSASPAQKTLTLKAGQRGVVDPGTWGNALYVKIDDPTQLDPTTLAAFRLQELAPASITGSALTEPIDMSALPSLSVIVDGEATPTILKFQTSNFAPPAQATRAQIRDAINGQTTKILASISSDNKLVLTSTGSVAKLNKTGTSLQVTAANATLGFANAMTTPVQGTLAARTTTGTQLTNAQNLNVGDVLHVVDRSASPAPHSAYVKILNIASTGAVQWSPAIADIASYSASQTTFSKAEFTLTIASSGNETANIVETWPGLSMESDLPNYAPKVLNDPLQGSSYVTAVDASSPSGPGVRTPQVIAFTQFLTDTPGHDGKPLSNDLIGNQAAHTGFYAFDAYDVQLVCCEDSSFEVVTNALAYCANRGDCMYVGFVPKGMIATDQTQAIAYGQHFQGKKVYGALYGPYVKVFDPLATGPNAFKWIPPVGHVMGVYARIETTRGIWKAPAGDEANLLGVLDVAYRLSDAEHTNLVLNGSINGIRAIAGAGIVIDASRTLSTDTRWLYVNVRLLFNYVKSSLKRGTRWVRQEPNTTTLWNTVKHNSVIPFLIGLWRQGAFGAGAANQVFTVICDASNNPPDQVDLGIFKLEVYFYPSKPPETIVIIVGQQASGAQAGEA